MLAATARFAPRSTGVFRRTVATLPNNPHIKVFDNPHSPASYVLTYLDTKPPSPRLAVGTCTSIPPTPQTFQENRVFVKILNEVVCEYGHQDEDVISQARALASHGGLTWDLEGPSSRNIAPAEGRRASREEVAAREETGPGGASAQGGAGGAGKGGWVHLSDRRNPPDFGRIAWPEDILGSVEVDESGQVVGRLQPSGTYRIVTNEGILGLSPFVREKLVERLRREEADQGGR